MMQEYIRIIPALTECCNAHDYCYDICGVDKDVCDKDLGKCVKKLCSANNVELTQTERANLHQGPIFLLLSAF